MTTKLKNILMVLTAAAATVGQATAQQQMPQTTKQAIRGSSSIATEHLEGTVEYVEGNTLVVRMANGTIREFNVPESRRFLIDGREVTVHALKVGTKLSAMITTTTTPITDRTTTVGTGKVWWVAGKTVILTLPNGENRQYTVKDDYRFTVDGNKNATVFDLRKGMVVSAEKIVEEPRTEIVSNTVVSGQAPPAPRPVVAQTPPPAPVPREVAQARPAPVPVTPAPPPVLVAQAAPEAPRELPHSGSKFPLVGTLGLLMIAAGLGLCRVGRTGNL